jgi:aspartyl-tRNA(Asn)/glutamyl-tRNA(Gln) amidotransferase subunit C
MNDRPALNLNDVSHIAKLARLALTSDEEQRFLGELNSVLSMAEALDRVDITDLPETHNVTGLTNVWREDLATDTLIEEDVFSNAPRHAAAHFTIPKTL